jgi:hypothetical protein
VAFARPDFKPADTIPQGAGRSLRVVNVLEPEGEDRLPVLMVELATSNLRAQPDSSGTSNTG